FTSLRNAHVAGSAKAGSCEPCPRVLQPRAGDLRTARRVRSQAFSERHVGTARARIAHAERTRSGGVTPRDLVRSACAIRARAVPTCLSENACERTRRAVRKSPARGCNTRGHGSQEPAFADPATWAFLRLVK